MINTPRFRRHHHVEILPPDKVFFLSEAGCLLLSAQSCALVARVINGRRNAREIAAELAGCVKREQVYYVLALLETKGYIEEAIDTGRDEATGALWNYLGIDAATAVARLASTPVAVVGAGDVPLERLREALTESGIRVAGGGAAALRVVLVDDYLRDGIEALNAQALADGTPWLLAKANGVFVWIGPIFTPGRTGCWTCLAQRLRANRDVERLFRDQKGRTAPFLARPAIPATVGAALGLVVSEVFKWVVTGSSKPLDGNLVTLDTVRLEMQSHALTRRPQCPTCGDAGLQARMAGPIEFRSLRKAWLRDGGHRATSPEETLRRLEPHVSPLTGVVNKLVRITDPTDLLQHVYISGSNLATRSFSYDFFRSTMRSRTAGKGMSDLQAKVSAAGEAIERYSGAWRGDELFRRARAAELGEQAIHPNSCMLFSEAQYQERERWMARNHPFQRVPLPFRDDAVLDWAPLWSVTRRQMRYLPLEYCYYAVPIAETLHFCLPDSNGNAAGNTREEAILQGFLELVERDAVAIWWYNRIRRAALDLDSFDDPYMQRLRAFHASIHRDLWVLDVTSDLGIPAFVAVSRRNDKPMEDIVFAPAAHLDAQIGVQRALTELNQLVSAVHNVDREGYTFDDEMSVAWWKSATLANQPYLAPSDQVPLRRRADFASTWSEDLCDDLLRCQALVESRGMELLVLDQTRPDVGLPVVKVVVPGLRHFWTRFAPGRLYDVPVAMGWQKRTLAESELNPVAVFI
jgi:bacteriocin biosynthesis cyclodehydratase domain-containing protein